MSTIMQSANFQIEDINELGDNIRIFDNIGNLNLYSYKECSNEHPEKIKNCRGLIFNKDELIVKNFPYTMEYTEKDHDEIVKNIDLNNCLIYDSYEGSTIKIFYFEDKWYLSTNKKLDAYKSKWASKLSFGSYFKDALLYQFENNDELKKIPFNIETDDIVEVFANSLLDKNKQYVFLLLNNNENRIVCNEPDHPTIYHVGTFTKKDNEFILSMEDNIHIPYPPKHEFKSYVQIYEYVYTCDYTKLQGVIIFNPNNVQYKILNLDYFDLYKSRGNEASINFRYLQVRMDGRSVDMLKYLYPEKIPNFEEYENILYDRAVFIYESYNQRYKRKQHVVIPKEEYLIMDKAHKWHQEDRENNKVNFNIIIDILNKENPSNLNHIIRNVKLERKKLENNKPPHTNVIPQKKKRLLSVKTD